MSIDNVRLQRITDANKQRMSLAQVRPQAPRGAAYVDGSLTWDPPKETSNVTHYNVYVDTEDNLVRRVPVGQTGIGDLQATRVFISSYNDYNGQESIKVFVDPPQPAVLDVPVVISNAVAAVTASDNHAGRIADANRLVWTEIDITVAFVGNLVPQDVTYWISQDNGMLFFGVDSMSVDTVGQVIKVLRLVPAHDQSWKVAAVAGAVNFSAGVPISAAQLPAGSVISSSFTVVGLDLPAATLITSLTVAAGAGGPWPYNATRPDGSQYWSIPTISYDDTGAVADPEAAFIRITAQGYDASNTPVEAEHPFNGAFVASVGAVHIFGPLMGDYGTIEYLRLRVYACNRINGSAYSYADSTCATLQTGIGSGAGHLDVTVAAGGALPVGLAPVVVSGVSWSDVGPRRLDLGQNRNITRLGVSFTLTDAGPTGDVTIWVWVPDLARWDWQGQFTVTGSTPTVDVDVFVPEATQSGWNVAVAPGYIGYTETLPSNAVQGTAGSLTGYGTAASNNVSSASISNVNYTQDQQGNWTLGFSYGWTISRTDDPEFWTTRLAVQRGSVISGVWTPDPTDSAVEDVDEFDLPGQAHTGSQSGWGIPLPSDTYRTYRFWIEARSRATSYTWVVQAGDWPGGADYYYLTPTAQGYSPPAATDVTGAAIAGDLSTWARTDGYYSLWLEINAPTFTQGLGDANAAYVVITVRKVNGSGVVDPGDTERVYHMIGYGQPADPATLLVYYPSGSDAYPYLRYQFYVMNSGAAAPTDFSNSLISTKQINAFGTGVSHRDINLGTAPTVGVPPTSLTAPGNVTIGTVDWLYVDGMLRMRVPYTPPSGDLVFTGVLVEVEAPKFPSVPLAANGATPWDGTAAPNGNHIPLTLGPLSYDAGDPAVTIDIDPPIVNEDIRIRLRSVAAAYINPAGTAPSVVISVLAPTVDTQSSAAYCYNATWGSTPGVASAPYNVSGKLDQDIAFSGITSPDDVNFSGWEIWSSGWPNDPNYYQETTTQDRSATGVTITLPCPAPPIVVIYWLRSVSIDGQNNVRRNPIIPGMTPSAQIALGTSNGTMDLSQALQGTFNDQHFKLVNGQLVIAGVPLGNYIATNLASHLEVVSGVLGVKAKNITPQLIADFAIGNTHIDRLSVNKLAVVDSDIVNLSAAKITAGTLAAGVAYVGTIYTDQLAVGSALISSAMIGSLVFSKITGTTGQITNAMIQNLDVSKLNAGTVSAAISMTAPSLTITSGTITINIDSSNLIKAHNSSSSVTSVQTGDNFQLSGSSGRSAILTLSQLQITDASSNTVNVDSTALSFNFTQVITARQTGPGNPSFSALSDAQTWCSNLLTALRTHGLVT